MNQGFTERAAGLKLHKRACAGSCSFPLIGNAPGSRIGELLSG
ncbi:hypothetical protein SK3146_04225 [Paenibacillus konkukensis]|uniref:Uncharacterized protein n=1 Tax=Paenibacillus konkukensis TaxID=2020716 RepID=A0ABY4RR63_9BACL|nr:hypothetical protein SK3146_04225 [Paenibacillus konkukensis]